MPIYVQVSTIPFFSTPTPNPNFPIPKTGLYNRLNSNCIPELDVSDSNLRFFSSASVESDPELHHRYHFGFRSSIRTACHDFKVKTKKTFTTTPLVLAQTKPELAPEIAPEPVSSRERSPTVQEIKSSVDAPKTSAPSSDSSDNPTVFDNGANLQPWLQNPQMGARTQLEVHETSNGTAMATVTGEVQEIANLELISSCVDAAIAGVDENCDAAFSDTVNCSIDPKEIQRRQRRFVGPSADGFDSDLNFPGPLSLDINVPQLLYRKQSLKPPVPLPKRRVYGFLGPGPLTAIDQEGKKFTLPGPVIKDPYEKAVLEFIDTAETRSADKKTAQFHAKCKAIRFRYDYCGCVETDISFADFLHNELALLDYDFLSILEPYIKKYTVDEHLPVFDFNEVRLCNKLAPPGPIIVPVPMPQAQENILFEWLLVSRMKQSNVKRYRKRYPRPPKPTAPFEFGEPNMGFAEMEENLLSDKTGLVKLCNTAPLKMAKDPAIPYLVEVSNGTTEMTFSKHKVSLEIVTDEWNDFLQNKSEAFGDDNSDQTLFPSDSESQETGKTEDSLNNCKSAGTLVNLVTNETTTNLVNLTSPKMQLFESFGKPKKANEAAVDIKCIDNGANVENVQTHIDTKVEGFQNTNEDRVEDSGSLETKDSNDTAIEDNISEYPRTLKRLPGLKKKLVVDSFPIGTEKIPHNAFKFRLETLEGSTL